jgi:hypothetical protein
MKQRNYVAKHAQRSGAGKHKRKEPKMSYLHQEDWVHIDDHNTETDRLSDKVAELQKVIDDMKYDEAYVLSWIIGLRNNARNRKEWETVAHCDHIINLHSAVAQAQAHQMRSE